MSAVTRIIVAISLWLVTAVAAAQSDAAGSGSTGMRPNAGGEPDEVLVWVGLLDIAEIDDRQQVFNADIFVEISWRDDRLALPGNEDERLRIVPLDQIWHPRLTVVNNRGLNFLLPEVATVDGKGSVIVRQRVAGPLAVDLELHDFPFDTQRLPFAIVSYEYTESELAFAEESNLVAKIEDLSGNGWTYSALEPEPFVYRLQDDGDGASGIVFAVEAERDAAYYVLTLALPMTLILFLAWMTHWLPVNVIPPRMGTSTATVFSLIAFGVSFRLTLPKIGYLTDADRFVLYSTLLVFASLAVAVITVRWATTDRADAAERLTRYTRVAFPLLYGLIILLILTT